MSYEHNYTINQLQWCGVFGERHRESHSNEVYGNTSGISLPEKINESQKAYLLQVLACLDSKNFVHGNLRPAKFVVSN